MLRARARKILLQQYLPMPDLASSAPVVSWPRKSREASAICWLQGSGLRYGGRDGEGNRRNSENQKSEREKPSGGPGRGSSDQSPRRLMLQRGTASSGTEDTGGDKQTSSFSVRLPSSSASRPKADLRFRLATRENCEYALSLAAEGLMPAQAGPDTPSQPSCRHRWPAATRRRPALPAAVS